MKAEVRLGLLQRHRQWIVSLGKSSSCWASSSRSLSLKRNVFGAAVAIALTLDLLQSSLENPSGSMICASRFAAKNLFRSCTHVVFSFLIGQPFIIWKISLWKRQFLSWFIFHEHILGLGMQWRGRGSDRQHFLLASLFYKWQCSVTAHAQKPNRRLGRR